jgi:hypothetical protein
MYRELRIDPVIDTIGRLSRRIAERFPEASLAKVAGELQEVARGAAATIELIRKPHWPLRIGTVLLALLMIGFLGAALFMGHEGQVASSTSDFLQGLDAAVNELIVIGAAIVFLMSAERRLKRRRALRAMHELRSLAHIVDMHQLTKDPERFIQPGADTASSPKRQLTAFELARYLDYCSEMLSLIAKIGALYAEHFDDATALSAVDDLDDLTQGLSQKIWQKVMILNMKQGT